jgi:hypothetical protein
LKDKALVAMNKAKLAVDPISDEVYKLLQHAKKKETRSPWAPKSSGAQDPKEFLKRKTGLTSCSSKEAPKSAEEIHEELKAWLETKPPFVESVEPNEFGLAIGNTASDDLRNFVSTFEPLAANSIESDELREEGFKVADPNGRFAKSVMFI